MSGNYSMEKYTLHAKITFRDLPATHLRKMCYFLRV